MGLTTSRCDFRILLLVYMWTLGFVKSQPTIQEVMWNGDQNCGSTDKEIQNTLEIILLEIRKQSYENLQLRKEMNELKLKSQNHWHLLQKMASNMDLLIDKLLRPVICDCDTNNVTKDGMQRDEPGIEYRNTTTIILTSEATSTPIDITTIEQSTLDPNIYYPIDCEEVLQMNGTWNGTYEIRPNGTENPISVVCEMHHNEAWTLIQRRVDGNVNFYQNWRSYKLGFGDIQGEFWLGNENIFSITNQASYRLRIDMWDWVGREGNYYFSESQYFFIDNETNFYQLHVPQDYNLYTGFGGSGLRLHAGPFMTYDMQAPSIRENCAEKFHSGWWFSTCVRNANFNGKYYDKGYANFENRSRQTNDIYWPNIKQSLRKVVLKLKRVSDKSPRDLYSEEQSEEP